MGDHTIGVRIRSERMKAGLTLESLASRAGISTSFLGYIERDERHASTRALEKVAKALNVPVSCFFEDNPSPAFGHLGAAARRFAHIVKGQKPAHVEAVLKVAKAVVGAFQAQPKRNTYS